MCVCVHAKYVHVLLFVLLDWSMIMSEATSRDPIGSPSNSNDEGSLLLLLCLSPHRLHRSRVLCLYVCLRVHIGHDTVHYANPQTMCQTLYDHINQISMFLPDFNQMPHKCIYKYSLENAIDLRAHNYMYTMSCITRYTPIGHINGHDYVINFRSPSCY